MLCHHLGRVVQGVVAVFVGQCVAYLAAKPVAERLYHGEDDSSARGLDGVAFDEVVLAVGVVLVVVVQSVEVHHAQQRGVLESFLGEIAQVGTVVVAVVFDVELEFLFLYGLGTQRVDVLHHQVPVAHAGRVAGVFQQFHEQGLVVVLDVAREFTHLEGLPSVGVFIGDGQYLVRLKGRLQRHIAKMAVQRVFAALEQAGVLHFLVVHTTGEEGVEHGACLVGDAGSGVVVHHRGIQCVGVVAGLGAAARRPHRVHDAVVLAKVHKAYDVAGVLRLARRVGHPYLHTVDCDAGGDVGQGGAVLVVGVAEEVGEEEVAVLVVVVGFELEGRELRAAVRRHALRLRLLLADCHLQVQLAELQVGTDAEQG